MTPMQMMQAAVPALLMLAQEIEAKISFEICNRFTYTPHDMRQLNLTASASDSKIWNFSFAN